MMATMFIRYTLEGCTEYSLRLQYDHLPVASHLATALSYLSIANSEAESSMAYYTGEFYYHTATICSAVHYDTYCEALTVLYEILAD